MNFEEAAKQVKSAKNKYCKFIVWVDTLPESDKTAILHHIMDLRNGTSEISGGWLYRVCRAMGLELAQSRFYVHLSGECKCPK